MTDYYVRSGASGSNNGTDWTNAWVAFASAVTAATTANDRIFVAHDHSESLSATTTYTFAANVQVLCVNSSTGALATTAVIGAQATNYNIIVTGGYAVFLYGLEFRNGTGSTSGRYLAVNGADGTHFELESCKLTGSGTGTANYLRLGVGGGTNNAYLKLTNCTLKFSATTQKLYVADWVDMVNCTLDSAGSSPGTFIADSSAAASHNGTVFHATGCDFSHIGANTLIGDYGGIGKAHFVFSNCKIGTGSILAAATTVTNKGQTSAWLYNCASGDTHYAIGHYDAFGETTVSAAIYANDGASYDGTTNKCSWKIVTTANCSYYAPYVSPCIDVYHSGTSAISPYFESLRSGSTTKYQNDEVWAEFSFQGTSGSTKASFVNDRMTPLGSAADQTASSLGASDWTGEHASDNAYMKLGEQAMTPAEIGHIRGRICVGEPSITVYVDPKIRGLS